MKKKISKGWKGNPNYKPKYSLSIRYLREILTKEELKDLMDKYVKAKLHFYGK